ncbi:hypothetical protein C922_01796 [Plasmodium inui San Antonio 1]|uniref:Uncharacterized protein n=1 Tax=Plasmodium inui San Antonio 1 TaxID=1237626 RepID=W7AQA0_9APIC|nr:hypothetical protein C922_01796 [Plasmodium inui San Antonio 1]EUD67611.1 hypothetical protein C922_01796 [Plasmodium inui San Antonio 1]
MNKLIGAQIPRTWNNKAWGNFSQSRYVSANFEYSPSSTISRFKTIPIVERDSTKWQKSCHDVKGQQTFPDSNHEFFELIKKSAKDKKQQNDLSLWNKYCREVKIRVNEKNISPQIITTFFTFLSQTDYKNDRLISEVLNRCILRLGEFDLVHMCALLNALGRMHFRSAYFLDEAGKKLMGEGDAYFERHSPHYVCLLVNSLAKLGGAPEESNRERSGEGSDKGSHKRNGVESGNQDSNEAGNHDGNEEGSSDTLIASEQRNADDGAPEGQLLPRMVQRIQHRRAAEYSLVGMSLLLYNVSKFGLQKYYHLFGQFEKHIVKVKNDLNMIQLLNILIAYDKTSLLSLSFLDELLHIRALQGGEKNRKCCVHHLARLLNVSLSFVLYTKERSVPTGGSDALRRIGKQALHMFIQMYRQLDKCRGKDLPLVCQTLSRNRRLIIRRKGESGTVNSPYLIFSPPRCLLTSLFEKMTIGVKKYIHTYNHVHLSTILYCYASYDIRDRTVFNLIKLRSLKIFSSFGHKSFSFLFNAFKRMNIEDGVFEKSCLNRMGQLGHFSCVQSLWLTLSAYASVREERQTEDLSRLMFSNFRKVIFSVASPGVASTVVASSSVALSSVALSSVSSSSVASSSVASSSVASPGVASSGVASPGVASPGVASPGVPSPRVAPPNVGEQIARLTSLLTKVRKIPPGKVLHLLASRYPNYEHTLSADNCTSLLTFVSNLCASLTEKEEKPSWRSYYHFVNSLTKKILASSHLYRNKDLLINFLHGSGKTFPSFARCTKVDERKMFYFEQILRIVLPHVYPFIGQMNMGEIAVLVECLSKENYSLEAMAAVGSASDMQFDELGGAVLRRVKGLLRGGKETNEEEADVGETDVGETDVGEADVDHTTIRIANAITVWRGLLSLALHDKEVFQLMVQRCILSSPCLSSVTSLSQAIHYVCVYSTTSEPIPKKKHIGLLRFLLNIVHRLMVNEGVLHLNCRGEDEEDGEALISEENLRRFSKEPLLGKALTSLCDAVMIILPHVCNIETDKPSQSSHPSDNDLHSIAFRPLISPSLLHFYLAILKITEQVRQKENNQYHPFRRDELRDVVEEIRQCALGIHMSSVYVELPPFSVLVLGGAASPS